MNAREVNKAAAHHQEAARLLQHALSGKGEEALSLVDLKGVFFTTSIERTTMLNEWKRVSG